MECIEYISIITVQTPSKPRICWSLDYRLRFFAIYFLPSLTDLLKVALTWMLPIYTWKMESLCSVQANREANILVSVPAALWCEALTNQRLIQYPFGKCGSKQQLPGKAGTGWCFSLRITLNFWRWCSVFNGLIICRQAVGENFIPTRKTVLVTVQVSVTSRCFSSMFNSFCF